METEASEEAEDVVARHLDEAGDSVEEQWSDDTEEGAGPDDKEGRRVVGQVGAGDGEGMQHYLGNLSAG